MDQVGDDEEGRAKLGMVVRRKEVSQGDADAKDRRLVGIDFDVLGDLGSKLAKRAGEELRHGIPSKRPNRDEDH